MDHDGIVSKRTIYRSRRNSDAPAVRREAEEDWGGERSQSTSLGPTNLSPAGSGAFLRLAEGGGLIADAPRGGGHRWIKPYCPYRLESNIGR